MSATSDLPKTGSQDNLVDNEGLPEFFEPTKDSDYFPPAYIKEEEPAEPEDKPRAIINKWITVEPILFFAMFAFSLQINPSGSLMIDKICHVTYNYSLNFCKNYTGDPDASDKIQSYSADLGMYKSLVETIPAVLYCCFLGSWSDKHSRKFPIIFPLFGYLCNAICNTLLAYYTETPPEYLLISAAMIGLSGGMVSMNMGCYSYLTDITTEKTRTKRIAIADLSLFVSLPIGMALSSAMYAEWGYTPIYIISGVSVCVAILYSIIFLTETVESVDDGRKCGVFYDMFDVQNVVDNIKILTRKREGNHQLYISVMLFAMFLLMFPLMGEGNIMLLFVQAKFGWDQTSLGYYTTYFIVITAIGTIVLFRLLVKFKLGDLVLGAIGVCGMFLKAVIFFISFEGWMLYMAATVSCFEFIGMPTIRSFLSKLVTKEEIGKLYAVASSFEAMSPIVSSVVYTQMYKGTRDLYLGSVFGLSAGLAMITLLIFIWIHFNNKKGETYKRFEEEKGVINGDQSITA